MITLTKNPGKSGNISFLEESHEMFPIKRVYWIYDVTENAMRGNHSHLNSERIIVALQGSVEVSIENVQGESYSFNLHKPSQALFVPRLHWVKLKFEKNSLMIALSSCLFEDDVLLTDYTQFKQLRYNSQMS
ncbi:MAG TPA: FdtA/QdtA family cupin domain-containing protein [Cyclobacteriaceae bacterium]|nr:FdtA/QdtA family cupin domain-containing protein [Cyclobacteriaceae bacterium]